MCIVKTPKVSPAAAKEKPPQVFTNKYFVDRGADAVAARAGRNALKINLASTRPSAPAAGILPPAGITPPAVVINPGIQSPVMGGSAVPTIRGGTSRNNYGFRSLEVAR